MKLSIVATSVFFAIALSACGGDDAATPTTSSTTSTTATTSTSLAPVQITCATDDLDASVVDADAGAGQRNITYSLRNKTEDTCTTRGFPGMAFYSGEDLVVSGVDRAPGSEITEVTIEPNTRAYFNVGYSVNDTANANDCTPITRIDITIPNERTQLSLPIGETDLLRVCPSSGVTVTAIRATETAS